MALLVAAVLVALPAAAAASPAAAVGSPVMAAVSLLSVTASLVTAQPRVALQKICCFSPKFKENFISQFVNEIKLDLPS